MKLSIIIPCFNEEKNIPLLLKRFDQVIGNEDLEILLVENGSLDNSKLVMEKLLPEYQFFRIISVEKNLGYGHGIIKGLRAAKGRFLGWTHADMQTDPRDIIRAYRILERAGWDEKLYIKGRRKKRRLTDSFFTGGMSFFESIYLKKRLSDINAQPNIFSRKFYNRWQSPPDDFSLDLYALYLARVYKLKIIRFPVVFARRKHGSSSWNTGLISRWKFIDRTLKFSRKLKKEGIR